MKTQTKIAVALTTLLSCGAAGAANLNIDVGNPVFGAGGDAGTITGVFTELAFNQFKATSLYEKNGSGAFTGNIIDTNIGIAAPLTPPTYGQTTIGNLSPLTPPAGIISDAEGFGITWGLVAEYNITGTIGVNLAGTNFTSGPEFTGGFYNVYFDDYATGLGKDFQVLGLTLTGSDLQIANLDLFFDVNFAKTGFLFVDNVDASTLIPGLTMHLDTNVNPPIPNPATLINVTVGGKSYGARQTTLDGSISAAVPEPASIALIGLGLIGISAAARRKGA